MAKALDITGVKFGKLTALKRNGFDVSPSRKHIKWDCICECGKRVNVRLNCLRSGNVQSCGCLIIVGNNTKHGMRKTAEYETWCRIKARCLNANHPDFKDYGKRGIKLSDDWMYFEKFYADMGDRPSNKHSIDRIDNNGNYSKENCRWALIRTQSRNKRNNRFYEFNGKNMCIADWSAHLGIKWTTLHNRLKNWPLEQALSKFKEN